MFDQLSVNAIQQDIMYMKDHISDVMEDLFDDYGNRLKDPNCN